MKLTSTKAWEPVIWWTQEGGVSVGNNVCMTYCIGTLLNDQLSTNIGSFHQPDKNSAG